MSLFKQKPKTEREKVEERRDEVLARGRKFKYPMQYAKHKLVVNTVIIALVAIVLMMAAGWAMLYRLQDTGDMLYRVTQVIPVSVAEVDGAKVRYSDYLMIYRSSLTATEQQGGQLGTGADADLVRDGYKKAALYSAVEFAYAEKIAKEKGITVSEEEIDTAFEEHRKVGGVDRSEEGFLKILADNFGMNRSEYRRLLYLSLIKAKVARAVDTNAANLASKIESMLSENPGDFVAIKEFLGDAVEYEETGGLVNNMNVDGGRSTHAMSMEIGSVSGQFLSSNGDGYYYLKLNDKTNSEVNYASLKVNFTAFDQLVADLYEDKLVKTYIEIGEDENL